MFGTECINCLAATTGRQAAVFREARLFGKSPRARVPFLKRAVRRTFSADGHGQEGRPGEGRMELAPLH
ncbi:hypothetical protein [uncultured Bilophila sp.]|uniref:hypothetical protein n=1 Tax=uncultured Bilophila sp. TaxID=529385 RepID=UPI002670658F|nr:hypothetical protein [uncultured Bilophila sp.]